LLIHRSQPLLRLVKQLNDYSNNVFAPLADAAGGAAAVQSMARSLLPASMQSELVLGDGAGADSRNRMSPRVAVRLLRLLEAELAAGGHALTDALPVTGVDEGTLKQRLDGTGERGHVAGKTGTYGDYGASALAGAFNTREHGRIYFAILNRGVPVVRARRQQDAFVRLLLAQYGSVAWDYRRDASLAVTHAEVLSTAR
jgi:D-alanyl-D-alanine carboxypeptidase/D-alanyl-D-alanine-endopeptidase (penicillin-binding protein 4)